MANCKVLIMVQASDEQPFKDIVDAQMNTWDSIEVDGVETVYYLSKEVCPPHMNGKRLYVQGSNALNMTNWRFKLALDFIWKQKFDYIFRTNASTYVRKQNILEYCKTLKKNKVYEGVIGGEFISGTGILMSRDVAKLLKDNIKNEPTESEDVSIGQTLGKFKIKPTESKLVRLNYNFAEHKILPADYYRCKSEVTTDGKLDRSYDIKAFNELHNYELPINKNL